MAIGAAHARVSKVTREALASESSDRITAALLPISVKPETTLIQRRRSIHRHEVPTGRRVLLLDYDSPVHYPSTKQSADASSPSIKAQ